MFVVMRMSVVVRVWVIVMMVIMIVRVGVGMVVRGVVIVVVAVVVVGRVGILAIDENTGFARCDAASIYGIEDEGCAEMEGRGGLLEESGGDAGVDQGAQEHVSAEASEAFEITNAHDDSF